MGTTYLDLTNKVLRKLNEIELTSVTFASATGFQALCKDLVQEAIDDINQAEFQWPFNHGEVTETLVADQATYALPSDVKIVDWSSFFLEEDTSLSVNASTLPIVEYYEWHNKIRSGEDTNAGTIRIPQLVYRTQDEKYGLTPIPDRAYSVKYEYWKNPTPLDLYSDTTLIPSQFDRVIVSYAMIGAYDFRENFEMAGKERTRYQKALKHMKKLLINRNFEYAYDGRIGKISGRANGKSMING